MKKILPLLTVHGRNYIILGIKKLPKVDPIIIFAIKDKNRISSTCISLVIDQAKENATF